MKNLMIGMGFLIIILLMTFSLLALNTNSLKEDKVEDATRIATYQTLRECMDEETWPVISDKLSSVPSGTGLTKDGAVMAERFKINLKQLMDKNDIIKVKIIASDKEKGVLSVEVADIYNNFGLTKTAKSKKTVIYEDKGE